MTCDIESVNIFYIFSRNIIPYNYLYITYIYIIVIVKTSATLKISDSLKYPQMQNKIVILRASIFTFL